MGHSGGRSGHSGSGVEVWRGGHFNEGVGDSENNVGHWGNGRVHHHEYVERPSSWNETILDQKNVKIKELHLKLEIAEDDKEVLKNKISSLEESLRAKEDELSRAKTEINNNKIEKDFDSQLEKSWKHSYDKEVDQLKKELEVLSAELNISKGNSYSNTSECQKCNEVFSTAGVLRRHTRGEHDGNAFINMAKQEAVWSAGRTCFMWVKSV